MRKAQTQFASWLESIPFEPPAIPIVMNVSAAAESDPRPIRDLVVRNLTEPVQWRESMRRVKLLRPTTLFEIGPGRVLAGLARANGFGAEVRVCTVNNLRGLALAVTGTGFGP